MGSNGDPANGSDVATSARAAKKVRICVYCGSAAGNNAKHLEAARELGRYMAEHDIELIYGGGTVGLMGEIAKTVVSISGPDSVHGIIPSALIQKERSATYSEEANAEGYRTPLARVYGRTTVVRDIHVRKQRMAQEVFAGGPGSGFIALSGGYGTLEELFETATWNQLGMHGRGVCLLNVDGFYDGLLTWLGTAVQEGFVRARDGQILISATSAESAVRALGEYKASEARYKLSWDDQYVGGEEKGGDGDVGT